jgi:hypothetical protein
LEAASIGGFFRFKQTLHVVYWHIAPFRTRWTIEGSATAEEIRALWKWTKVELESRSDAHDQNPIAATG